MTYNIRRESFYKLVAWNFSVENDIENFQTVLEERTFSCVELANEVMESPEFYYVIFEKKL